MEWLADIGDTPIEQRTRRQWAVLGAHHAQALVARHLSSMDAMQWRLYRRAVLAAARHEYFRLALTPEGAYWAAFHTLLDGSPKARQHLMGKFRVIAA